MILRRACEVCGKRFSVSYARRVTCSVACRIDLHGRRQFAREAETRPLAAGAPREPNRAREALADTRAAVEKLLAEGRRLARAS